MGFAAKASVEDSDDVSDDSRGREPGLLPNEQWSDERVLEARGFHQYLASVYEVQPFGKKLSSSQRLAVMAGLSSALWLMIGAAGLLLV